MSRQMPRQISRQISRQLSRQMTRQMSRQASVESNDQQRMPTKQNVIIKKLDELGEIGAPYYSPHTEILSTSKHNVVVGRSFSH
jgi:hypothetical protein